MVNYYDILGLPSTATYSEIKSAFRRLAKLYHPDKNPGGQEEFKKILRAYETLSHPTRKSAYDLKLKYHHNSGQNINKARNMSGRKNWSFEEKELRRRQYYEEHIKKYEKKTNTRAADIQVKSHYNEYKYILFATPIAVALFLLIIHLATSHPDAAKDQPTAQIEKRTLKMGDAPYLDYFGTQQYNIEGKKVMTIKNNTGTDIIVCLFNENEFLRSCFIADGYFAEIPQLPEKPIKVRYSSGSEWDFKYLLKDVGLYGAFTKNCRFYKSTIASELGPVNEITLVDGVNEGFVKVNEKDFFNKN